ARSDEVYNQFPLLYREDPYYQRFSVRLTANSSRPGRAGFLEIYNATTGEVIPSCDRQFTVRNAQVVCRELGLETMNAYHWLTPRWEYNPQIRLVKTYVEPRECRGNEESLDRCHLRLTGNDSQWMCMDNEHFNYIYCGKNSTLDP
ncbi:scavenger receptor cysteine-rich domain protein, partial [Oesophagostomum dentatum]